MHAKRHSTSLPGTVLILLAACLGSGCASAFRGDLRGHHSGDYTALPADWNLEGRAELVEAQAPALGAADSPAHFEQDYQRRVDRLGSSGTAAKSCADFLAGCFGMR
jgi:hypothetical protein